MGNHLRISLSDDCFTMNRNGLVLVAVFGWLIVTAFVTWTVTNIVHKHQQDNALVSSR